MEGIFVNGRPLMETIKEEEEKEKAVEIDGDFQSTAKEISRSIYKPVVLKSSEFSGHEPVKILTDDEIRKEKGIMQKPYKSMIENVVHVLLENGGTRVTGICSILGKDPKRNSSWVSNALKFASKHCPDYIIHGEDGRYHVKGIRTVEEFMKFYNAAKKAYLSDVRSIQARKRYGKGKEIDPMKLPWNMPKDRAGTPGIETLLENPVKEWIEKIGEELKLKIEVTGSIKIVFALDK